jgi:hypothetical protein
VARAQGRSPVGHHEAKPAEAALGIAGQLAQDVGQQVAVFSARLAIDVVVRGHDARGVGLLDHDLERARVVLAQVLFVDDGVDTTLVVAAAVLVRVVARVVLHAGGHALGTCLQAAHEGRADLADQHRIFTVRLLRACPGWVAQDIDGRRQDQVRAHGTHLRRKHGTDALLQPDVEGRCAHLRDGEGSGLLTHHATHAARPIPHAECGVVDARQGRGFKRGAVVVVVVLVTGEQRLLFAQLQLAKYRVRIG